MYDAILQHAWHHPTTVYGTIPPQCMAPPYNMYGTMYGAILPHGHTMGIHHPLIFVSLFVSCNTRFENVRLKQRPSRQFPSFILLKYISSLMLSTFNVCCVRYFAILIKEKILLENCRMRQTLLCVCHAKQCSTIKHHQGKKVRKSVAQQFKGSHVTSFLLWLLLLHAINFTLQSLQSVIYRGKHSFCKMGLKS